MDQRHSVVPGNLRAEMARRHLRQVDLAAKLNISQQAVSQKLNGRRPFTDVEVSIAAKFVGINAGELFREDSVLAPTEVA
jgi:transcriptional regulator with XRE-family HTH domain